MSYEEGEGYVLGPSPIDAALESMLFDISRRVDNLAKEVHLLKATDKSKESS
jgi:hypothetical protein